MDIRSKTLLVTCYVVPLLFFAIMGGIFTSLMPEAKHTLIQSMTVMGVSMGALFIIINSRNQKIKMIVLNILFRRNKTN